MYHFSSRFFWLGSKLTFFSFFDKFSYLITMGNKSKRKRSIGKHSKKRSLGSGHIRGYLYSKIMAFSWLPIFFLTKYLFGGYFIGFSGTLNSNLTLKLRTNNLRVDLYIKSMVFSCRPISFTSCDSCKGWFSGFFGTLSSNLVSKNDVVIFVVTYTQL